MIDLLKSERGSLYIELIISISVILALLIIFANFFAIMNTQFKLNNLARQAIRVVEVEGGLTQKEINYLMNQISSMGLDPSKATIEGSYYPVQLRNPVYVKIKYTMTVNIPLFDLPIRTIELGARMEGSSEKFFK
ncbi:DUF4320 family protein [Caldanaerobacter subterraneus]|uniref:DUF4320 family protein n=1 Tax=Caldanaerobacter subterraneus TaxID=911092 RepID=A0A7Y2L835_9THEO|nr:DUF4320 family protein [Caldanaerobacter subterraneus]